MIEAAYDYMISVGSPEVVIAADGTFAAGPGLKVKLSRDQKADWSRPNRVVNIQSAPKDFLTHSGRFQRFAVDTFINTTVPLFKQVLEFTLINLGLPKTAPCIVTSSLRLPKNATNGSLYSRHNLGVAIDFRVPGRSLHEVEKALKTTLRNQPIKTAIILYQSKADTSRYFIHIDFARDTTYWPTKITTY